MKNEKELIEAIIYSIGDDPTSEHLVDTPRRVIKSWEEIYCGYEMDPAEILSTVFKDGSCKEMVILKDIHYYSMCIHHMLPFYGKVSIGYLPEGRVIGLSKLARIVECFSRRLQIQERMTSQIADSIMGYLTPRGCMVKVEGEHLCMQMRGVKKENSKMITSAIRGVYEQPEIRSEFLELIK